MELRDGNLLLRPMEAGDEEAIVAGLNDPDVVRFLTLIPAPYTADDAVAWLDRCRHVWADGSAHPFAIVDADSGELVGSIEVATDTGAIGYWVARHVRSRGIATRALQVACAAHPNIRLWLFTHPENAASQRVAKKAGFRRTGIIERDPPYRDGTVDAVRFELDRSAAPVDT